MRCLDTSNKILNKMKPEVGRRSGRGKGGGGEGEGEREREGGKRERSGTIAGSWQHVYARLLILLMRHLIILVLSSNLYNRDCVCGDYHKTTTMCRNHEYPSLAWMMLAMSLPGHVQRVLLRASAVPA